MTSYTDLATWTDVQLARELFHLKQELEEAHLIVDENDADILAIRGELARRAEERGAVR